MTVKMIPADWFAALSTVVAGAVRVSPTGATNVTVIAVLAVRAVEETGLTVILAAVPGPVAVLQVRVTGDVAVSTLARMVPAPMVRTNNPPSARALRFFDTSKSNWRTFLC